MVVLRAVEDSLAGWDSLATALRGAGWAVLMMDVRGTGWSVGAPCPLPEAWEGREDEMSLAVAGDVHEGLRALALVTPVDTTRYVVLATGTATVPAALAAERDRRVEALVLLSPAVSPVERGWLRALLARTQVPLFLSQASEDYLQFELFDAWYQAGNRAASRIADARGPDHGAWPFRLDHTAAPRLIQWLSVKKPARAKSAPPRPPRR
jgi:pimeloyl-ACP methyl ester carboxylesterase